MANSYNSSAPDLLDLEDDDRKQGVDFRELVRAFEDQLASNFCREVLECTIDELCQKFDELPLRIAYAVQEDFDRANKAWKSFEAQRNNPVMNVFNNPSDREPRRVRVQKVMVSLIPFIRFEVHCNENVDQKDQNRRGVGPS